MSSVPKPSLRTEHLERTHILQQILRDVDAYSSEFDKVDYDSLKQDVLKPVLAETFDPETQIRGFLKTFRHTPAYKSAFSQIESLELKDQIEKFIDGKGAKDVVGTDGFHLLAHKSPPVHHHFSLLAELKKLMLGVVGLNDAVKDVLHPKHKHVKDLPIVYEDAASSKVVEVGTN